MAVTLLSVVAHNPFPYGPARPGHTAPQGLDHVARREFPLNEFSLLPGNMNSMTFFNGFRGSGGRPSAGAGRRDHTGRDGLAAGAMVWLGVVGATFGVVLLLKLGFPWLAGRRSVHGHFAPERPHRGGISRSGRFATILGGLRPDRIACLDARRGIDRQPPAWS